MEKTAVHFGAGNIGRGFIAALLSSSGYRVTFIDIVDTIIDALKEKQEYTIEIVGDDITRKKITNVTGLHLKKDSIKNVISNADIITTAVGVNALVHVAQDIALGIKERTKSDMLCIIACENVIGASSLLQKEVEKYISADVLNARAQFINCAVDRVVPVFHSDDILLVRTEEYCEWLIDKKMFVGDIPNIYGMQAVDNLQARVMRKLFTLNTGHTIIAWLFAKQGKKYIKDIINDSCVLQIAECAMRESGVYLIDKFGFDQKDYNEYVVKILKRFSNTYINDDVLRVGRQPIRKLSANERIFRPVAGILKRSLLCDKLLVGAAAGLHFFNKDDAEAQEQNNNIKNKGVKNVLDGYIDKNLPLRKEVIDKVCFYYNHIDEIMRGKIV